MTNVYCESCGVGVMSSVLICPSCGCKSFLHSPNPSKASPNTPMTGISNVGVIASNDKITALARDRLKGFWWVGAGATIIYYIITLGLSLIPNIGIFLQLASTGPLSLGWAIFSLAAIKKEKVEISLLLSGFNSEVIWTSLGAYLVIFIFVFLWTLLLIIPGIIAALSYSMTYYIIAEDNTVTPLEAISKSKALMHGHKSQLFFLCFRFIGWGILSLLTLGIGFLFLIPYAGVSLGAFYENVKQA